MTFWQEVKRELGRETQPVDTVVRLIILERAIRGSLVFILGIALLTRSRSVVSLVRQWVTELDVNPERRLIPRILITVLRPIGEFSSRTVLLIGIGAMLFGMLELTEAMGLARRRSRSSTRPSAGAGPAQWPPSSPGRQRRGRRTRSRRPCAEEESRGH